MTAKLQGLLRIWTALKLLSKYFHWPTIARIWLPSYSKVIPMQAFSILELANSKFRLLCGLTVLAFWFAHAAPVYATDVNVAEVESLIA